MTAQHTHSLLVELLTEELPPKALPRLGATFAATIVDGLKARGLAAADAAFRSFASPRSKWFCTEVTPMPLNSATARNVQPNPCTSTTAMRWCSVSRASAAASFGSTRGSSHAGTSKTTRDLRLRVRL